MVSELSSIIVFTLVPTVFIVGLMVLSMPETFIEPVKATLLGLRMMLK